MNTLNRLKLLKLRSSCVLNIKSRSLVYGSMFALVVGQITACSSTPESQTPAESPAQSVNQTQALETEQQERSEQANQPVMKPESHLNLAYNKQGDASIQGEVGGQKVEMFLDRHLDNYMIDLTPPPKQPPAPVTVVHQHIHPTTIEKTVEVKTGEATLPKLKSEPKVVILEGHDWYKNLPKNGFIQQIAWTQNLQSLKDYVETLGLKEGEYLLYQEVAPGFKRYVLQASKTQGFTEGVVKSKEWKAKFGIDTWIRSVEEMKGVINP